MTGQDDPTRTRRDDTSDTLVDAPSTGAFAAGERIGRYEVVEELGRGGMGVVYRARDPELDRPLAIKVVLPRAGRSQQRLLDEARALAKLRHPAVVPVFDVGTVDDCVYIVMPLLGGGTMHDWARVRRPWREVLARYVAAGRGLAAAHAAGLVHRDFKPRNVLVGDSGEVMVGDFGLAANTTGSLDGVAPPRTSPDVTSIEGTPAYMAPEQAAGQAIDARADQYSFCIAFWEALHGERPHEAVTRSGSALPVAAIPTVPADRRGAPRWLLVAITRGFAGSPAARWPSMTALLDHIERRLRRPRRLALAAGALAVIAGTATAFAMMPAKSADPCPDPRARLASAWSPEVRARVEAAFAASTLPFASDALTRVVPALDAYAKNWRASYIEVCRAGRVAKTQSNELLDRRMACFDRNVESLGAFTRLLATGTPEIVRKAVDGVARLPAVADCADERLVDTIPLPTSEERRAQVREIDRQIAASSVERLQEKPAESLQRSAAIIEDAREADYAPTLARALHNDFLVRREQQLATDDLLRELAKVAAAARDDVLIATAWRSLVDELARQGKLEEAATLTATAQAATTRAGGRNRELYSLDMSLGTFELARGNHAVAESHYRRALELAADSRQRRVALFQLASTLIQLRRVPEARAFAEESAAITREIYGSRHPEYGRASILLAQLFGISGKPEDIPRARAAATEALEIARGAYGENHVDVASAYSELTEIDIFTGRYAEAEQSARRAVEITSVVPDDFHRGTYLQRLGTTIANQGRPRDALPYYEQALAHNARMVGTETAKYAGAEINFANRLLEQKDYAGARARALHALATFEKQAVPPGMAVALRVLAQCDLHDGDTEAFVARLERAIEICSKPGCSQGNLEGFEYDLGSTLVERRIDRAKGLRLVRKARDGVAKLGRDEDVKEVDAWLAKHGARASR
jgi:eukaryotic-like serine/threonine-protein kinase